ncbi:hypothetical protein [Arthrobacter sp. NPDC058127]|uniref:hypothetical protein n=1 Tax=Arthrobacter sp. NPDC058127 TaxID=3346351 RepID=UPI0036E0B754
MTRSIQDSIAQKLERRNALADELGRIRQGDIDASANEIQAKRKEQALLDTEIDALQNANRAPSPGDGDYSMGRNGGFTRNESSSSRLAMSGDKFIRSQDNTPAAIRRGESFGSHPVVAEAR